MNEQLIVKNFGPIKDATVDFKKVTVFIGPTGGGKSTLAKLAAVFRNHMFLDNSEDSRKKYFKQYSLDNFLSRKSEFIYTENNEITTISNDLSFESSKRTQNSAENTTNKLLQSKLLTNEQRHILEEAFKLIRAKRRAPGHNSILDKEIGDFVEKNDTVFFSALDALDIVADNLEKYEPTYIPTERVFIPAIEYSWSGLMRDDIGLPKNILNFANLFNTNKKEVSELDMPFLNAKYIHLDGHDFIKIPESETLFRLYETASGIQSVTPLLILIEFLSKQNEFKQSFIIEEPEINLFPLAQYELIKILIDKCANLNQSDDLIITTHSPYVLTALNLMCYAYRIAQQDEATAKKVAKLIPRNCWIDPAQFAAYYVDLPGTKKKQQVRSIINKKTGLIEENELDTASLELGDIFNKLVRLRQPAKAPARAK